MQTRSTLAVIDDRHLYTVGHRYEHEPIERLERLLTMAKEFNVTHIWILEKSQLSATLSGLNGQYQGWDVRAMKSGGHIGYLSALWGHERGDQRIMVGFAEYAPWPWYMASNPKTLLATIAYLEDALGGLPIEWTPAHMALDFVKSKNLERWDWFSRLTLDLEKEDKDFSYSMGELHHTGQLLPLLKMDSNVEKDFQYGSREHVVKLDGNSDYGAFMTSLRTGEGKPCYCHGSAAYDGLRPGFWRVSASHGTSIWDGGQLPSFESMAWMTTDLVEQLRRVGYQIDITGGWYWAKYHQALRSSISDKKRPGLWDLRVQWREQRTQSVAHDNVYESISAILHTVHGKFGEPDLSAKRFRRPDILAMVIAGAMARKIYRIEKIRRDFGLLPSRIDVDACWYAVETPDQLDSIIDPNKLGGWKKVYCIPVTPELRAAWSTLTVGQLNALAQKKEVSHAV